MKKIFKNSILVLIIFLSIIAFFNIPTTTRQGINGELFRIKIPLYVKLCGFLYRDYQYRDLSRQVVKDGKDDKERIALIYEWTIENIKPKPEGFPTIDDHIWDIIVRRYGTNDQRADVFTTLASYAGYDAFFEGLRIKGLREALVLSFVKVDNKWQMFDIYNKKSFMTTEDLTLPTAYGPTYSEYLETMDKANFRLCIWRPNKQALFPRIIYELIKLRGVSEE